MFLGLEEILGGIIDVLSIGNFLSIVSGIILGLIVGAAPGLNAIMAIAIAVPLTFYMSPLAAIAFLIAVNKGGTYGGSVTAILVNTPGSPESAATCFDGHPLAKAGKAEKALKMSLYASVFGDTFSDLVLILVAPPLALIALKMGPPEITAVILFSLTLIAAVAGRSLLTGLISACFGFLITLIGTDPIEGTIRLSFGIRYLENGIPLVPIAIGMLAITEVFNQTEKKTSHQRDAISLKANPEPEDRKVTFNEFKGTSRTILRGSFIGTAVGALPGVGAVIAAFLSYGAAKRASKNPELFGKGSLEGLAAAESANNAVIGSNLIPLFSLGIPGNVVAAILIGAFMIHGIIPGPMMFQEHGRLIAAIFAAMLIANLVNFIIGRASLKLFARITDIPRVIIFPVILILCITGAYISTSGIFGVVVMFVFGVIGYLMGKLKISYVPMIIGFILGPIFEVSLRQSLILSGNSLMIFITHPIALVFVLLTAVSIWRLGFELKKKKVF
jgi:putative tricarboxylic transport membrane protein